MITLNFTWEKCKCIIVVPSCQRNLDKSEFNGRQLVKDRKYKAKNTNFVLLFGKDQVLHMSNLMALKQNTIMVVFLAFGNFHPDYLTVLSYRKAYKTPSTPPLKPCPSHHPSTNPSPCSGTWAPTTGCICTPASSTISFVFSCGRFWSKSLNFLCAANNKVFRSTGKVGIV